MWSLQKQVAAFKSCAEAAKATVSSRTPLFGKWNFRCGCGSKSGAVCSEQGNFLAFRCTGKLVTRARPSARLSNCPPAACITDLLLFFQHPPLPSFSQPSHTEYSLRLTFNPFILTLTAMPADISATLYQNPPLRLPAQKHQHPLVLRCTLSLPTSTKPSAASSTPPPPTTPPTVPRRGSSSVGHGDRSKTAKAEYSTNPSYFCCVLTTHRFVHVWLPPTSAPPSTRPPIPRRALGRPIPEDCGPQGLRSTCLRCLRMPPKGKLLRPVGAPLQWPTRRPLPSVAGGDLCDLPKTREGRYQ